MGDLGTSDLAGTAPADDESSARRRRTEMDVERSQLGWVRAALAADEPELARQLASTPVPGAEHDDRRLCLLAESLVLLGRPAEAWQLLANVGVQAPGVDESGTWPQAVLAAALAACGDRAAWSWMTSQPVGVPAARRADLTHLVASVADQRGEATVADEAWASLVHLPGASSPRVMERAALVAILQRRHLTRPEDILSVLERAVETLRTTAEDDVQARQAALRTADLLEQRGDRAGARLLLRVLVTTTPHHTDVARALRRLTPPLRSATPTLQLAAVMVGVALVEGWVLWAGPHDRNGMTPGLFGGAVAALTLLLMRLPARGFTPPEKQVWLGLRSKRYDPVTGRAASGARWSYALAGIVGAVGTFTTFALVLSHLAPGGWPAWALTGGFFALMFCLSALAGAACVLAVRQVSRRRRARSRADREAQELRRAGVCTCAGTSSIGGTAAVLYAGHHLTVPGPPVPLPLPNARLWLCPLTHVPWLVGPLAAGGRTVALRGAVRGPQGPTEGETPTGPSL